MAYLVKKVYGLTGLALELAAILPFALRPLATVMADQPRAKERRHCISAQ